jgi:hypothetical protein
LEAISTEAQHDPIVLEGPPSFENFLALFDTVPLYPDWAFASQHRLLWSNAAYGGGNVFSKALADHFRPIPTDYIRYLRLDVIERPSKPWYEYPEHFPNPEKLFSFHAFAKEKRDDYWLISYFARNMDTIGNNSEYEIGHVFALATYSLDGKPLDEFSLWCATDEVYQLWDHVGMAGDTILEGHNPKGIEGQLPEVDRKTIITPKGKFKTVFKDYEKPDPDRKM